MVNKVEVLLKALQEKLKERSSNLLGQANSFENEAEKLTLKARKYREKAEGIGRRLYHRLGSEYERFSLVFNNSNPLYRINLLNKSVFPESLDVEIRNADPFGNVEINYKGIRVQVSPGILEKSKKVYRPSLYLIRRTLEGISDPVTKFIFLDSFRYYGASEFVEEYRWNAVFRNRYGGMTEIVTRTMKEDEYRDWHESILALDKFPKWWIECREYSDQVYLRRTARKAYLSYLKQAQKEIKSIPFDRYHSRDGPRAKELAEMRKYFTQRFSSEKYAWAGDRR